MNRDEASYESSDFTRFKKLWSIVVTWKVTYIHLYIYIYEFVFARILFLYIE